jgi:leucyl-tRNA synthetase
LEYFPPIAVKDLQKLGISSDWRRSFITTDKNPFYNSFVEWHFKTLEKRGKLHFGKRHSVYCIKDGQPCADHDRATGEGVAAQEYTLIKLRVLELPKSLEEQFKDKKVFMVAATLRPETMFGQTNIFVLPDGEYGVYEMKNDEYFITSERSVKNMAY